MSLKKMAGNLKAGVPQKARLLIAVSVGGILVVGGFIAYTVSNTVGVSPEERVARETPAIARVSKTPTTDAVSRDVAGDAHVLPETSPIRQATADFEAKRIEAAKTGESAESVLPGPSVLDDVPDALEAFEKSMPEEPKAEPEQAFEPQRQAMLFDPKNYAAFDGNLLPAAETVDVGGAVTSIAELGTVARAHSVVLSKVATDGEGEGDGKGKAPAPRPQLPAAPCPVCDAITIGDIAYGVMETAVNSDEPSPVLAKVLAGPLRGARLVGKQTLAGERVVIEFDTLSLGRQSYTVRAFAVDPATQRTALATDVDHHYFERYGALVAASFISGMAKASTGSVTTTQPDGTVTESRDAVDGLGDQVLSATGEVATAVTPEIRSGFNRPVTVEVDGGTPVGILFLAAPAAQR